MHAENIFCINIVKKLMRNGKNCKELKNEFCHKKSICKISWPFRRSLSYYSHALCMFFCCISTVVNLFCVWLCLKTIYWKIQKAFVGKSWIKIYAQKFHFWIHWKWWSFYHFWFALEYSWLYQPNELLCAEYISIYDDDSKCFKL